MRGLGSVVLALAIAAVNGANQTFGRVAGTNEYHVKAEAIEKFKKDGYAILENVLSEAEVAELEVVYDRFMRRDIYVPGKDFCDMSKPFDTPFDEYSIINCMLPTTYYPPLKNNVYERVARRIVEQLYPGLEMDIDYDQLLNKRPEKSDAVFGWHQDMAYWPSKMITPDTRTVTFSLAIDGTNTQNGCIKFVPGSGTYLRNHRGQFATREEGHAVAAEMFPEDNIVPAPVPRGSMSIHDEWVVHGSGGNDSKGDRRTYVVAFRPKATIAIERSHGFTHSHNDVTNWDTFQKLEAAMKIKAAATEL